MFNGVSFGNFEEINWIVWWECLGWRMVVGG